MVYLSYLSFGTLTITQDRLSSSPRFLLFENIFLPILSFVPWTLPPDRSLPLQVIHKIHLYKAKFHSRMQSSLIAIYSDVLRHTNTLQKNMSSRIFSCLFFRQMSCPKFKFYQRMICCHKFSISVKPVCSGISNI